jgi:hypothetical protein
MKTQAHSSWLSHNWRWFAPVVCVVVLLVAGLIRIVDVATNATSVAELYHQATTQASHDPTVIAALGQPITSSLRRFNAQESESSRTIQGNRIARNFRDSAALTVELAGPKDVATLHIRAAQSSGHWNYQLLTVDTGHQQHIDVLKNMAAHAARHI